MQEEAARQLSWWTGRRLSLMQMREVLTNAKVQLRWRPVLQQQQLSRGRGFAAMSSQQHSSPLLQRLVVAGLQQLSVPSPPAELSPWLLQRPLQTLPPLLSPLLLRLSPARLAAHRPVGRRRMRETLLVGRRQRSRQVLLPPFVAPRELRVFFRVDYRTALRLCGVRTPEPRKYIWRDESSGRQFECSNRRHVLVPFAAAAHACKLFGLRAIPVDPEPDWPHSGSSGSSGSSSNGGSSSRTSDRARGASGRGSTGEGRGSRKGVSPAERKRSSSSSSRADPTAAAIPVVALLGQINHGKTTLLDRLSGRLVAPFEAGGATQNLSAVTVTAPAALPPAQQLPQQQPQQQQCLSFIDTPGHASFAALRGRASAGADVACVVIDVTAGKGLQTEEALLHADRHNLPVIFALNKCDTLLFSSRPAAAADAAASPPALSTAADAEPRAANAQPPATTNAHTDAAAAAAAPPPTAAAAPAARARPPGAAAAALSSGTAQKAARVSADFETAKEVMLAKYELRRQCQRLQERGLLRRDLGEAAMHAVCISALHGYGLQKLYRRLWEAASACEPRQLPSACSTPQVAAELRNVKRRSDVLVEAECLPLGIGVILEISKSSDRGLLYTVLVKQGRFAVGNYFVAGSAYGRIRSVETHYAPLGLSCGIDDCDSAVAATAATAASAAAAVSAAAYDTGSCEGTPAAAAAAVLEKLQPETAATSSGPQQQLHWQNNNHNSRQRDRWSSAAHNVCGEEVRPGVIITCGVSPSSKSGGGCCVDDRIFIFPQERAFRLAEYRKAVENLLRMQIAGPPLEIWQWEADHPRLHAVYGTRALRRAAAAADVRTAATRQPHLAGDNLQEEMQEDLQWTQRESATRGRRAIEEWGPPEPAAAVGDTGKYLEESAAATRCDLSQREATEKTAAATGSSNRQQKGETARVRLFRETTREEFEAPLRSGRVPCEKETIPRRYLDTCVGEDEESNEEEEGDEGAFAAEAETRKSIRRKRGAAAVGEGGTCGENPENWWEEGKGRLRAIQDRNNVQATERDHQQVDAGIGRNRLRRRRASTAACTVLPEVAASAVATFSAAITAASASGPSAAAAAMRRRQQEREEATQHLHGQGAGSRQDARKRVNSRDGASSRTSGRSTSNADLLPLDELQLLPVRAAGHAAGGASSSAVCKALSMHDFDSIAIAADASQEELEAVREDQQQQQEEAGGCFDQRRDSESKDFEGRSPLTKVAPACGRGRKRSRRAKAQSSVTLPSTCDSSSSTKSLPFSGSTSISGAKCEEYEGNDFSTEASTCENSSGRRNNRVVTAAVAAVRGRFDVQRPSATGEETLEEEEEERDGEHEAAAAGTTEEAKRRNLHQPWAAYGDDREEWQRVVEEKNEALMSRWRHKARQRALERQDQQRRQRAMLVEAERIRRQALGEPPLSEEEIVQLMGSRSSRHKGEGQVAKAGTERSSETSLQEGGGEVGQVLLLKKNAPVIPVILRSDAVGTFDVLLDELEKLQTEFNMRIPVVHGGIGPVIPRDVVHAEVERTYGYCPVYAFRVPVLPDAVKQALATSVVIKRFDFFMDVIDDVRTRCQNVQKLVDHNLYVRSLKTEPTRSGL